MDGFFTRDGVISPDLTHNFCVKVWLTKVSELFSET